MRVGSLFSGYGGLDLAVGGELVWYSEIDKAASQVMAAHYPDVTNIGDITQYGDCTCGKVIPWDHLPEIDVLTGGYPCQPFSNAGQRKGKDDERHLWPYVRSAISSLRPRITVLENVRGHLSLGFADVLRDCAADRLSARWITVRAADAGAPHNRARLFFVITDSQFEGSQGIAERILERSGVLASSRQESANSEGSRWRERSGSAKIATGYAPSGISDGGWSSAADSDVSGGEAWRHSGSDGERFRIESVGSSASSADPSGERYGSRQGPRGVEGMGGEAEGGGRHTGSAWQESGTGSAIDFGDYEPAIRRWEAILGRSTPDPTIRRDDRKRLNPAFVEWMMGLPEGWVTGHGLSVSQELKMLGNGVVPQQAALALRLLLSDEI